MTDDQRLTDRLAALVSDEPPFETDLGTALWAAESGGRRRRARATAIRTTSVILTAAATFVVALVIWWPASSRALPPAPAGTTSVTRAVVEPTLSPTATRTSTSTPDALVLRQLLDRIVAQAGSAVKMTKDQYPDGVAFTAYVRTKAGPVDIGVEKDGSSGGVGYDKHVCRDGLHGPDGKGCGALLMHDTVGIWEVTNNSPTGRRRLTAAADTPGGGTLWVTIDNYVEEPDGNKVVGPSWQEAGITVTEVRAAIADSGLALPDR